MRAIYLALIGGYILRKDKPKWKKQKE